jgi:hypothetical protein
MEKKRRPGDLLLEHYASNLNDEECEEARERFKKYALLLARCGRIVDFEPPSDSTLGNGNGTIHPSL